MNAGAQSVRPIISLSNLSKRYGQTRAVDDVSFDVPGGACVVMLGPSGCGKTTLLKMVNRLLEPSAGRLIVEGLDALAMDAVSLRRRIGYVIQQVGLFPHMNVAANVGVVPSLIGWSKTEIAARVDELLQLVGLDPALYRKRYPSQLSGGQQQRVGLARALAADPAILLMDEPFGAIDSIERARLQDELRRMQATLHKTILFVTHDVDEALRLADSIVIMREGKVQQYDTPLNILSRPANEFVAQLVGAGDVLRRLSLMPVRHSMHSIDSSSAADEMPRIDAEADMRQALSSLVRGSGDALAVQDRAGKRIGMLTLAAIQRSFRAAG